MTDRAVERGADNVARRCLVVAPGEKVLLLEWRAEEVADAIAAGIVRAGGVVRRVSIDDHVDGGDGARTSPLQRAIAGHFAGVTASVAVTVAGLPVASSAAIIDAARSARTRHLQLTRTELRVLGQSMRADPDLIQTLNERVVALLKPPATVRMKSDAGTDLTLVLSPDFRIQTNHGRPASGEFENLPAGEVYTHPATTDGRFVVDRGLFGSLLDNGGAFTRRAPVTLFLEGGAVTRCECTDAALRDAVTAYLGSHVNARRVGLVSFPTNYLVRSEIGSDVQDGLLPGMKLCLGITAPHLTGARFDAPVQLRAFGRQLTIDVGTTRLVTSGRFSDELAKGLDPFR